MEGPIRTPRHYPTFEEPKDVPHRSIVLWPDTVKLGCIPNESVDTHSSKAAAEIVCQMIEKKGFGGLGKIFPISTRVEPRETTST